MDYIVRSPQQATTVYGLDGSSAPRSKNLFYVRFVRTETTTTAGGWETNLGFVVKSVDRPSIQPQIEEVNQYNKKRQITTGFKIQPMRLTLYDTADSMAMRMWSEYANYYYGDFTQSADSFVYDATTPGGFQDISSSGFGFVLQQGTADSTLNSPFFFKSVEVYQVFGGQYTQFTLINPKINAFDPDELDYNNSEMATITMTLSYEAIIYANNNEPATINSSDVLSAVFNQQFNGNVLEVEGAPTRQNLQTTTPNVSPMSLDDTRFPSQSSVDGLTTDSGNTIGGGSLAQFGNYDFGSLSPSTRLGAGTAGDVSYLASGNPSLSTLLNMPVGTAPVTTPESIGLGSTAQTTTINASLLDSTQGALRGAGSTGSNSYATSYIDTNLVPGVAASSILTQTSPGNQLTTNTPQGLALNSQSYGIINSQRPSYSQIGYNFNSSSDALSSAAGAVIPGKYNTNGIPTAPIPYDDLNTIDPA